MPTWKTIPHYPNYQVHPSGKVRNKTTGKCLRFDFDRGGYIRVKLYNYEGRKNKRVHVLVAQAFLDWYPGCDVNHEDRDKTNNAASNLTCMGHKENMHHWMKQDGKLNIVGQELPEEVFQEDPF